MLDLTIVLSKKQIQTENEAGPPLKKFHWMATSSCWLNRRQMPSRRYLIELSPPVAWPKNGIPDTNNAEKATTLISLGTNLTIPVCTDTFVEF